MEEAIPTNTTNYSLAKPLVNNAVDQDLWGGELNGDLDSIDSLLRAGITVAVQGSQAIEFTPDVSISVKKFFPCDMTIGAFSADLPSAPSAGNGATVYFQKVDSTGNMLTVKCAGSDTINGVATLLLSQQYQYVGLVSDGVSVWKKIGESQAALPSTVRVIKTQTFTSSGTYTPSTGMLYCEVEMAGGGGGGAGGGNNEGGGGSAAAYCKALLTATTVGASQTVTIGAAGAGGISGSNNGTAGTATSFGAILTANGGGKGNATSGVASDAGGTATGGDVNITGQRGGQGLATIASGAGGSCPLGFGGPSLSGNNAGLTGTGFGSGGSGGISGGSVTGGGGGAGIMYIIEYCSQ